MPTINPKPIPEQFFTKIWDQKKVDIQGCFGLTPYQQFENQPTFISDAYKFAILSGRRLGFPIVDVQLTTSQFFTAYQLAIMQYSSIINQFNIKQNLLSLQGSQITKGVDDNIINLTHKPIYQGFGRVLKIAQTYADQINMGANTVKYKSRILTKAGQQVYDLKQVIDNQLDQDGLPHEHKDKPIQIIKVFHNPLPISHNIFNPFIGTDAYRLVQGFGMGNMSMTAQFTMMPIFADLLRMNSIKISNTIRRSHFGFSLQGGNKIRLFPVPQQQFAVWFQYRLAQDVQRFTPQNYDNTKDYISDPSNAPFEYMQYSKINSVGRTWIINYAHALVKGMLGNIRGKYNSIPIPDSQISLDGDSLKSQSQSQRQNLINQLNQYLETASRRNLMEVRRAQVQDLNNSLNHIPLGIFIG